jgi:hypothetical protein
LLKRTVTIPNLWKAGKKILAFGQGGRVRPNASRCLLRVGRRAPSCKLAIKASGKSRLLVFSTILTHNRDRPDNRQ